mmetsp:Transcript_34719/g.99968  ORF Transcript_34719/g.99968 Transcript_34719/m.99968 type:complete len:133 (-) Transcript_34719:1401-1799(-)
MNQSLMDAHSHQTDRQTEKQPRPFLWTDTRDAGACVCCAVPPCMCHRVVTSSNARRPTGGESGGEAERRLGKNSATGRLVGERQVVVRKAVVVSSIQGDREIDRWNRWAASVHGLSVLVCTCMSGAFDTRRW